LNRNKEGISPAGSPLLISIMGSPRPKSTISRKVTGNDFLLGFNPGSVDIIPERAVPSCNHLPDLAQKIKTEQRLFDLFKKLEGAKQRAKTVRRFFC
jgi:hypothetical protein